MTDTVLENLSGRKLIIFVAFLLICQFICFMFGGLIALKPGNLQDIHGSVCVDGNAMNNDTTKWFYSYGKNKCRLVNDVDDNTTILATDLVYVFEMPVRSENKSANYVAWQQSLVAVMQVDITNHFRIENRSVMTIDARLAYRNEGDPESEWKFYAQAVEKRNLDCDVRIDQNTTKCEAVPLFELSYLSHEYYLLNIRLPVDPIDVGSYMGYVENIMLTVLNQNESYTAVWVSLKTVFFLTFFVSLIWFYRRIRNAKRKFRMLEKMLLSLGITNCFLAMPLEYLPLRVDLNLMSLIGDIRQLMFYAKLFSFWLVFAGEHMMIQEESKLKHYWKNVLSVIIGCILIFIFDIYEKGVQLRNPFYTFWLVDLGFKFDLASGFVIIARIALGIYFLFLCYKLSAVFVNIHRKPQLYVERSLHYEGIVNRFKLLILVTIICAALTVANAMLGLVADWKMDENIKLIEYTSMFFTGVYGTWNLYIFALLILYAPSQKRWDIKQKANVNLCESK